MLSQQQIRSLIKIEPQQGEDQQSQSTLNVSHQELRKLKEIQLNQYGIERVNASYNYFKDFNNLNFKEINSKSSLPINWLDISFNFFSKIDQSDESAHVLQYLKYLNISANRIQSVDFSNLSIPLLEVLNLNNNRLQFFMNCPPNLKVLMLDHNRLQTLAFTGGQNLNVLSAAYNTIKKIALAQKQLCLLDMQSNLIDDLELVKDLSFRNKQLLSINFRENPVSIITNYKTVILEYCEKITQIDEVIISPHIREGFKILKTEERLGQMLEEASKKYENRLQEKQKIKEELIKKIKNQQKGVEQKFETGIKEQRQQFEILQNHAKKILGKNKFQIVKQQKDFRKKVNDYEQQSQGNSQQDQRSKKVKHQHLIDYLEYMRKKKKKQTQNQIKQKQQKPQLQPQPQTPQKQQRKHSLRKDLIPKHNSIISNAISEEGEKLRQALSSFKKIQLFDPKCVENLINNYVINFEQS